MLKGKTIVLGVTGSIAAYKIANLASALKKLHANVQVIMTKNATNFINPITFETLTGNKCLVDTFDRNFEFSVEHVSLAKAADVFMVAPCSANVIGKIAGGIADDMLTTTIMATKAPVLISPAMNTGMYTNPILQDNLKKLKSFGYKIIEPATGYLACGDEGVGKMPEPEVLLEHILYEVCYEKDLTGKMVLVTAGPTQEAIDPVRYVTNHSSGKMGFALAKVAAMRGAEVTLVTGQVNLKTPLFVERIDIVSAKDMADAVKQRAEKQDIIIKAAAVADYTPATVADEKIKKNDGALTLEMGRTEDILASLGANKKEGQFLCGFAMETQNLLENATAKLKKKNADMIVANSVKTEGAGFGVDTNVVTLITADEKEELPVMSKEEVACAILDKIVSRMEK